jgi:hypothetical protein
MAFGGSMGADNDSRHNMFAPDRFGAGYDLKVGTQPLSGFTDGGASPAIQNEVSVISQLRIPTGGPGGRFGGEWHVSSPPPLLAGTQSFTADINSSTWFRGPSCDQIMVDVLDAGANLLFPSLVYCAQPRQYTVGGGSINGWGWMSYKRNASGGVSVVVPQSSPQAAWRALFGNFTRPATTGEGQAEAAFQLKYSKSILDVARASTQRLLVRLGAQDRARLQDHLDQIRALEDRVSRMPPMLSAQCKGVMDPGGDPTIGGGYSNEDRRAQVFMDLIQMAFICDLTRVATLMLTCWQSRMGSGEIAGVHTDVHGIGHNAAPKSDDNSGTNQTLNCAKAQAWAVKSWGSFVHRLRTTSEASGGRLIDNTATALMFEGGHGPGEGKQYAAHSSDNMICCVAGRTGGLKVGQHIAGNNQHPAQVLLTLMRAVGYKGTSLGEVNGELPGLRA